MQAMSVYLTVFLGAGVGGAMRHAVNSLAVSLMGIGFPYGTMTVNIVGSFVMGFMVEWFARKVDPGQSWRLFLTTGMLGGFTTFSTFSLDSALFYERGQYGLGALYVGGSVLVSLVCVFAGLATVRAVW